MLSENIKFCPSLPSNQLPLTFIYLKDWKLIKCHGIDAIKFLQGQLTCDVTSISNNNFSFAAHCNIKGKTLSNLCIFYHEQILGYIVRRSVYKNHLIELKKYAIFSKITINDNNEEVLIGIAGSTAELIIKKIFGKTPKTFNSTMHCEDTTILYYNLPSPRFLLITTKKTSNFLYQKLKKDNISFGHSNQWLALDIEAGYPIIDNITSACFFPQTINLEYLKGINFNKGCYIGQEIIAKNKYRGINKYTLYFLTGHSKNIPSIGNNLELKINKYWKKTGTILASCKMKNNEIWIQAILEKKLTKNNILRIYNNNININNDLLTIRQLPYIINK